jgi:hypothetical protein
LLFRRCVRVVSIGKRLPTSIALEPIVTIVWKDKSISGTTTQDCEP